MKKNLLSLMCAVVMAGSMSMSALTPALKHAPASSRINVSERAAAPETPPASMVKQLPSYFTAGEDNVGNYYLMLASTNSASYDRNNGVQIKNGFALFIDLYAPQTEHFVLPTGTYKQSDDNESMTFDPYYTYLAYYDANGKHDGKDEWFPASDVTVTKKEGSDTYVVALRISYNGRSSIITYEGELMFADANGAATAFPQIRTNLNLDCKGSFAVYDGNLYQSNTGSMYLNIYEKGFNPETGGMTEAGYSLALQLFGKLFSDSKKATLDPGTYTMSRNFSRYSWYPGIEVEYMGMSAIMGCYAKQRTTDGTYAYSYIADGTIVVEDMGADVFRVTVDCVTNLGYTVKAKFEGTVPVVDKSDDHGTGPAPLSTLEDDVQLDLKKIKQGHIWNGGVVNNCQTFLLDIGSPSGRDEEVTNGGDIMRIEFVSAGGTRYLEEGTYTVMDEKYDTFYEPFKLGIGRFVGLGDGSTDISGTRYMHFEEGRYMIMDHYAPAVKGTVAVTKNDDDTHTIDIALMCDKNFRMDGSWTGPIELMYNPDGIVGIEDITAETKPVAITYLDNNTIAISNNPAGSHVAVYTITGMKVSCPVSGDIINIESLASGIYILSINNQSFKIVKK